MRLRKAYLENPRPSGLGSVKRARNIPDAINRVRRAIIKGVQANGDRIFDRSQVLCPVRTGTLKHSGDKIDTKSGFFIIYKVGYSARVEFGVEGKPIVGTQEVSVKGHDRGPFERKGFYNPRFSKYIEPTIVDRHYVQPHVRTYVNKRLVNVQKNPEGPPIWRVIGQEGGFKGRFYLTNAVKEGIRFLVDDIGAYLKRLESTA